MSEEQADENEDEDDDDDDDANVDDSDLSHPSWKARLSQLADYRKIHGHCNVPKRYSETSELAHWVQTQRKQYKVHLEGKTSPMTPFRIQELESMGFEWDCLGATWKSRLSELADYRTIHGHCNVPRSYIETPKLAHWVRHQRKQYRLHLEGKTSPMTPFRIQELESMGFEWKCSGPAWEDRLSELADYRKVNGHCNVPHSEKSKLGNWVATQRKQYRMHREGKPSQISLPRIQELESLGFKWVVCNTAWDDRLSELANYRKIHGHCNVPQNYGENTKLGRWVTIQRSTYKLHVQGKAPPLTLPRIQELESLGFEWKPSIGRKK
jgi:hypothetical protein